MKKHILVLLSLILAVCLTLCSTAADKSGAASEKEIIQMMKILKIMEGDQYGNLNLDNDVTRAEFSKILVQTSGHKDDMKNVSLSTSLFPDVRNSHWASGYISVATQKGYIKGYLNGTFRPENKVTLEEAVTMVLRLLGYTESDLTGAYPYAQISKYESLGLDYGVNAIQGDKLSRRQCMMLIYNTLCAYSKSGKIYCETLGYSADAGGNIDYSLLLSAKTDGPFVIYDSDYQKYIPFSLENATVYRDGNPSLPDEISVYDVVYYSKQLEAVWCYDDKVFGTLDGVNPSKVSPSTITVSGKQYNLSGSAVSSKFSAFGDFTEGNNIMLILDRSGNVCDAVLSTGELYEKYKQENDDYLASLNSSLKGPYVVHENGNWKKKITLPIESLSVYYKNEIIDGREIRDYDVIYYSEAYKSIWVYRESVTGIINAINPSLSSPSSVNLSGKVYNLETADVKYKLSSFGSYKTGDFVTLILDRNKNVAEVIDGSLYSGFYDEDEVSYTEIVNATLKGPYIVTDEDFRNDIEGIDFSYATVYKDKKNISADDISLYDVLYYSDPLDTVWVYDRKEVGIVEEILPDNSSPAKIKVSGNVYDLETEKVKFKVSSLGIYGVGDTVTVLIGKNGACADIISYEETTHSVIGVVTGFTENQKFTDKNGIVYSSNVAHVYTGDGVAHSYQTNASNVQIGAVVRCSFEGDRYTISRVDTSYSEKAINDLQNLLDFSYFADDCNILDVYGTLSKKVHQKELYGMTFERKDVLYFSLDSKGYIKDLVLNDYTGDLHSYAYIVDSTLSGLKYNYQYITEGQYKYCTTTFYAPVGGASFEFEGEKLKGIKELIKLKNATLSVNSLVTEQSGNSYPIASDVQVYIIENGQPKLSKLSVISNTEYIIDGYADDPVSKGGKIRVIIAR